MPKWPPAHRGPLFLAAGLVAPGDAAGSITAALIKSARVLHAAVVDAAPMKVATAFGFGFALVGTLFGCGTVPPPEAGPKVLVVPPPTSQPIVSPSSSASAVVEAPPLDTEPLFPVQRIWSLIDVVAASGTIEIRVGTDPGGGMMGKYSYIPVVNGAPVYDEETSLLYHADTAGGFVEVAGKRPNLVYHVLSGFRSKATDRYFSLDADNDWIALNYHPGEDTEGGGIYDWSGGRLLEFRRLSVFEVGSHAFFLPQLAVVQGSDKTAPTVPKALEKKLKGDEYFLLTRLVYPTGEVVAVGKLKDGNRLGTLVWTNKPKEPTYFVTDLAAPLTDDDARLVGGDFSKMRLRVPEMELRLEGGAWVLDRSLPKESAPEPESRYESVTEDGAGVTWATKGDLLLSSKKPAAQLPDMTEKMFVEARKKSILRGGSNDAPVLEEGETIPYDYVPTCRKHYVLLAKMTGTSDTTDYPEVRKVLKGHAEFAGVRWIVSRERSKQFFGAQIADADLATKLEKLASKQIKGGIVRDLCAEPPVVREIKIDLITGSVNP